MSRQKKLQKMMQMMQQKKKKKPIKPSARLEALKGKNNGKTNKQK